MPKCLVTHYLNPETNKLMYVCHKGLSLTKFSTKVNRCWRYNCPGVRPLDDGVTCKTPGCESLKSPGKSLYCSQKCRSRESSRKYRQKKKNGTLPTTQ